MLTGGHIAASYLLAETAKSLGVSLTGSDVLGIIIAGNIMDIDFVVGFLTGKTGEPHHQNISHTPVGAFLFLFVATLILHPSPMVSVLFLMAMFIHLTLDEVGYWGHRVRLYTSPVNPQINWLYPFTPFHKHTLMMSTKNVLRYYLINTWPVSLTEVLIILIALFIFFR